MTLNYTRPPWRLKKILGLYHIIGEDKPLSHHIATILGRPEAEANAKLISKAPQMYEALKEVDGIFSHYPEIDAIYPHYRALANEVLSELEA